MLVVVVFSSVSLAESIAIALLIMVATPMIVASSFVISILISFQIDINKTVQRETLFNCRYFKSFRIY